MTGSARPSHSPLRLSRPEELASNLRVQTWRRLQRLGAIPRKQSVSVLPDTEYPRKPGMAHDAGSRPQAAMLKYSSAVRLTGGRMMRSSRSSDDRVDHRDLAIHPRFLARGVARSRRPLSRGQTKGGKVLKKSSGKGPYVLRTRQGRCIIRPGRRQADSATGVWGPNEEIIDAHAWSESCTASQPS